MFRNLQFAFVLLALALLVVAFTLRTGDLPPALAALFPQAIQNLVQKPLTVEPITAASLAPTETATVEISVSRHGRTGPVAIDVSDVPEGIKLSAAPIPDGASTTRLELTASEALGDADIEANVTVRATIDKDSASQQFLLRVPRVGRPSFAPLGRILLKPGMEETVALKVRRNGFTGPLVIRGLDPPTGVEIVEAQLPGGSSATDLLVTVAHDSAEGTFPIALTMSAYGRQIVSDLPLVIDSTPYRVRTLRVVRVRPGETVTVDVPVERNSYAGPIQLSAVGPTADVTMSECTVPAGQKTASLRFQAARSAAPGVHSFRVRCVAGKLTDERAIVVRVVDVNDDDSLPREVVAEEAIGRINGVGSLGSRTSSAGKLLLKRLYGSSREQEAAIEKGLAWLLAGQAADGSWTPAGVVDATPQGGDGGALAEDRVAATALALLPLLAEGVTHKRDRRMPDDLAPYQVPVERGLKFLTRIQAQDKARMAIGSSLMGHALATLALAETHGLEPNEEFIETALKNAIAHILKNQQDRDGGWREQPAGPEELSATVWDVMALRTARHAHVSVPGKAFKAVKKFMDACGAGPADSRQSLYANTPGGKATPTATATGLFIRQLLDRETKMGPALLAGCGSLMANLPSEDGDTVDDLDFLFFATQVLRNKEGDDFDLWHHLVRERLVRSQEQTGPRRGSWQASGEAASLRASRMYATSLSLLTLQVCYRNLPLYRPVKLRADDRRDVEEDQEKEEPGANGQPDERR